jgi:rubrerythrin
MTPMDEQQQSPLKALKEKIMERKGIDCRHACRNTCGLLTEAMRGETEMARTYEEMMHACDYPDVHAFIRELLEEKSQTVLRINQKLNELRARGQIIDGVISSYDPTLKK